jgi:hypothetical protein
MAQRKPNLRSVLSQDGVVPSAGKFLRRQDGAPAAKVPGSVKIVGLPANYAGALFTGALVSHSTDTTGYIAWTVPRGATIAINIPNFGFDWAQKVVPAATTVRIADL